MGAMRKTRKIFIKLKTKAVTRHVAMVKVVGLKTTAYRSQPEIWRIQLV